MDPITHTLAGAVIARVGGDRRTPLAAATLILAANAPDIDIISLWTATSFGSIAFRRGITHGVYALLILPVVVTMLIILWDGLVRRRRDASLAPVHAYWVFALAVIGVVSHPMLDWLNTYGVRFLMPMRPTWFRGNALFIIDPYWWMLLALTLGLAKRQAAQRTIRIAAALALAYPLVLIALSRAGTRLAERVAEEQGIPSGDVLYQPIAANPLRAQLIIRSDSAYHFGALRWIGHPRVSIDGPHILRGDWSDTRVILARRDPDVRDYLVWSQYPWVEIDTTATDGSVTVVFGDARFPRGGIAGGLGGLSVSVR